MSDFMQLQTYHGHFQRINNTSEGDILTPEEYAEYPGNEEAAAAYNVEPEDVETVFGWFARYSAPGYMDCTDWMGPYDTEEEAAKECKEMYGPEQPSTTDPDATADIEAWLKGSGEVDEHRITVFYEHGQHYASCLDCGASWSVVDSEPGPYDIEQLDEGDESCY